MGMLANITNKIPYGAHVIVLFVLTFAAFILTILVTFSTPFIKSIYFLSIGTGDGETTFGAFGWCNDAFCLDSTVGYEYAPQVNNAMTGAMILWAIGIIFLFFLLLAILPLLFIHESRALRTVGNRMFFMFSAYLSGLFIPLAWVLSIYGWSIARRTFEVGGVDASFGPGMWMGLTAALCIIVITVLGWPHEAWDGKTTRANGGVGARGLPGPGATGNGYYHYKRTTREVVPQGQQFRY